MRIEILVYANRRKPKNIRDKPNQSGNTQDAKREKHLLE